MDSRKNHFEVVFLLEEEDRVLMDLGSLDMLSVAEACSWLTERAAERKELVQRMFFGGNWVDIHHYSQDMGQSERFLIQGSSLGGLMKVQAPFGKDFAGFEVEVENYPHKVLEKVDKHFYLQLVVVDK